MLKIKHIVFFVFLFLTNLISAQDYDLLFEESFNSFNKKKDTIAFLIETKRYLNPNQINILPKEDIEQIIQIEEEFTKTYKDTFFLDIYVNTLRCWSVYCSSLNSSDIRYKLRRVLTKIDTNLHKQRSLILLDLAHCFHTFQNQKKLKKYLNLSFNEAFKSKDTTFFIETLLNIATIYERQNDYPKTIDILFSANTILQEKQSLLYQFVISSRIGTIFYLSDRQDTLTKKILKTAVELSSKIDFDKLKLQDRIDLNLLLIRDLLILEDYPEAQKILNKLDTLVNQMTTEQKTKFWIQKSFKISQTNLFEAKKYAISALNYSLKTSDNILKIEAYINLSRILFLKRELQYAEIYVLKATELAEKENIWLYQLQAYKLGYQIYLAQNKQKAAIKVLNKILVIQQNLIKKSQTLVLEKIRKEQSYEQEKKEISSNLNKLVKQKQKMRFFIIFISVLLLISVLSIYAYYRKNKVINRQKELIEKQKSIILKQYEKFRLLSYVASHTQNSIFIMDVSGKIIYINDGLLNLYKVSRKYIFEENQGDFKKLTSYSNVDEVFRVTLEERKPITYVNLIKIGKKNHYIQTTISPIIELNEVKLLIGIESDITELKKAQIEIEKQKKDIEFKNKLMEIYNKELKEKQEAIIAQNEELQQQQEELQAHLELLQEYNRELLRLSVIASETDNIIYVFDSQGNLIWVNDAFTRYTGFTLVEFIEKYGENIIKASTVPNIDYYFNTCVEEKKSIKYISEFTTKYGKKLWLQTTLTPIKDENNQVKEIVAIDADISEVKQAEQKIIEQHREINSSLQYASHIQRSVMPLRIFFNAVFENNFVYFRPKYIVSGDFYFLDYYKNQEKAVFAVADCTGHGIPGAFMSLLGTMALKTVLYKTNSFLPDRILTSLNEELIRLLHQRGRSSDTIDSIDMALCVIDFKNYTLDYAGANIPLYIFRNETKKLVRIKPTKATIGYDMLTKPFTVHSFKLSKGDRIYLSSDGIADQFGGQFNKKLKRKGFIELINYLNTFPIEDQYEALDQFLHQWMGSNDQVDDILMIGIEF